jgi:hypothetical protein
MFSQRERSLDNLLGETRELKERIKEVLPSYTTSLKELSSLPGEFERRFWASRVEALLQTVKADYENFRAKAQKVEFLGKFMTLGIDMVLKAGAMEPIAPPPPTQLGISVSPSGKIAPDWVDNPYREPEAIFVTYEEFVAIGQRLKDKLLRGTIVPSSEDEIPRLIYGEASA